MSCKKDGGPAFPVPTLNTQTNVISYPAHVRGMSLRHWYAGQSLIGIASLKDERVWRSDNPEKETVEDWRKRLFDEDADTAFGLADAMIQRGEKQ